MLAFSLKRAVVSSSIRGGDRRCIAEYARSLLRRSLNTAGGGGDGGTFVQSPVSGAEIAASNQLIDHVNTLTRLPADALLPPPRLFAVVSFCGRQYKVTENDIIVVEHNRPFDVGDRIRMEKVLMVGAGDFSLVGRPTLSRAAVCVEATVIEKTLSNTEPDLDFVPRRNFRLLTFVRNEVNLLRINKVRMLRPLERIDNK